VTNIISNYSLTWLRKTIEVSGFLHPVLYWNQRFCEYMKSLDGILKKSVPHLTYIQKNTVAKTLMPVALFGLQCGQGILVADGTHQTSK
jgi:hypothetical protein